MLDEYLQKPWFLDFSYPQAGSPRAPLEDFGWPKPAGLAEETAPRRADVEELEGRDHD
jgi:hypothetical protein